MEKEPLSLFTITDNANMPLLKPGHRVSYSKARKWREGSWCFFNAPGRRPAVGVIERSGATSRGSSYVLKPWAPVYDPRRAKKYPPVIISRGELKFVYGVVDLILVSEQETGGY